MSIELAGITLPDLWFDPDGRFGDSGVDARISYARDTTPHIWGQAAAWREMDLIGGADAAWMDHATLTQMFALAAVPNAVYTLSYEGTDYTVRFRHWDMPVISAQALVPRPNTADTDYYKNVRIRLLVRND